MKFQLLVFASLVALTACKPAVDEAMTQLLRSCDHNADNALDAAEFAGCLMQQTRQQRVAASRMGISRIELLRPSVDESDKNNDMRADEAELQVRSARSFDSGLLRSGFEDAVISKTIVFLKYIGEENCTAALDELYALIYDYEFSAGSRAFLSQAVTAFYEENYCQVSEYIFSFIREIVGSADDVENFSARTSTVKNVVSLLQVLDLNDSAKIISYIYRSLAGIIEDLGSLSEGNAGALAILIQTVIENDLDEFYISLDVIVNDPGISTEVVTAVTGLNNTVVNGSSSQKSAEILAVLNAALESKSAPEVAQIFSALIQATMDDDRSEAIEQVILLYSEIIGSVPNESGFSSNTIAALASITLAIDERNDTSAVAQIVGLKESIDSGLSYCQISALEDDITEAIEAGDYEEAIADIVDITTSQGSSSVEISVEVFVALSSVITSLEDSNNASGTIALIEEILSDSSITVNMEIRSALRALNTILSEETTQEALAVITSIMTSSSQVFDRSISSHVAEEVQDSLDAIDTGNLNTTIDIVQALLRGERGGSGLSVVVRDDLKKVLQALLSGNRSKPYSLLTVIAAGSRSSSLPTSATAPLIVAIHSLSTGTSQAASFVVSSLEPLVTDKDLDSSFKERIQAIINDINDAKYAKALSAVVVSLLERSYSLSESVSQSLFNALQLTIAGNYAAAIEEIASSVGDLNEDLQLVVNFIIHILLEDKEFGAKIALNDVLSEAN